MCWTAAGSIQERWLHLQYVAWGCLVLNIQLFYAKEANYETVTVTGALHEKCSTRIWHPVRAGSWTKAQTKTLQGLQNSWVRPGKRCAGDPRVLFWWNPIRVCQWRKSVTQPSAQPEGLWRQWKQWRIQEKVRTCSSSLRSKFKCLCMLWEQHKPTTSGA